MMKGNTNVKSAHCRTDIGHVFKYPYSYYDLLQRADDPALAKEWDAKAYHVFYLVLSYSSAIFFEKRRK